MDSTKSRFPGGPKKNIMIGRKKIQKGYKNKKQGILFNENKDKNKTKSR